MAKAKQSAADGPGGASPTARPAEPPFEFGSVTYQAARAKARAFSMTLKSSDFHSDETVLIQEEDGSIHLTRSARLYRVPVSATEWFFAVIGEHHEPAVYHPDEVAYWAQFKDRILGAWKKVPVIP